MNPLPYYTPDQTNQAPTLPRFIVICMWLAFVLLVVNGVLKITTDFNYYRYLLTSMGQARIYDLTHSFVIPTLRTYIGIFCIIAFWRFQNQKGAKGLRCAVTGWGVLCLLEAMLFLLSMWVEFSEYRTVVRNALLAREAWVIVNHTATCVAKAAFPAIVMAFLWPDSGWRWFLRTPTLVAICAAHAATMLPWTTDALGEFLSTDYRHWMYKANVVSGFITLLGACWWLTKGRVFVIRMGLLATFIYAVVYSIVIGIIYPMLSDEAEFSLATCIIYFSSDDGALWLLVVSDRLRANQHDPLMQPVPK